MLPWGLTARTVERIAAGLVIVGLLGWIYHQGGKSCRNQVQTEKAHQETEQAKTDVRNAHEVAREEREYHETISRPVDPVPAVRLCRPRSAPVPTPRAPTEGAHEAPLDRSDHPHDDQEGPGPDIGPELVTAGRNADAQVKGLQDYILNVCLKPRP